MEKTICELFAGVGGFRLGLERLNTGWETTWFSQWEPGKVNQWAHDCYVAHFGDLADVRGEYHTGEDISLVDKKYIPDHNLLVGGFPCQDYSVAHTLASSHGIEGKKGVLWWQIRNTIIAKKPAFCLFENVDRLLKSPAKQRGRDFGIILSCLASLNYSVEWRVVNAATYGAPQTDLFEELCKRMNQYNPDPNKVINIEQYAFVSTGNVKDKVRIDLYCKTSYGVTIYEGKKDVTTSKDVYQLRMYWDGLVYDGIVPTKGILVASNHPESVKSLVSIVNTMCDANGNNYNFETRTWEQEGIIIQK